MSDQNDDVCEECANLAERCNCEIESGDWLMDKQQISNIVLNEISAASGGLQEPSEIKGEMKIDAFGLDSLDRIEIAMEIEIKAGLNEGDLKGLDHLPTVEAVIDRTVELHLQDAWCAMSVTLFSYE